MSNSRRILSRLEPEKSRSNPLPMIMRSLLLFLLCSGLVHGQAPQPAKSKVPVVRAQVTVGTQQRPMKGSSFRKTMSIEPKLTIEGASRIVPLPALEATLLLITMDTRAKYQGNLDIYRVLAKEAQPIPAAPNGERRQFRFGEHEVSFDSYRDRSNIGGEVYKYFIFGLKDPATNTLIDFQTNDTKLAAFCKTHPERREEFLQLKQAAKYPAQFK